MSSEAEIILLARECINRAKIEETPSGDPLVAAREYLTAMEHVQSAAARIASSFVINNPTEVAFFLCQVKKRLIGYEERVALLLGAAREMGLNDKPEPVEKTMEELFKLTETGDLDILLNNLQLPGSSRDATHLACEHLDT